MIKVSNIRLSAAEPVTEERIKRKVRFIKSGDIKSVKILKRAIDARDKNNVVYNICAAFDLKNEKNEKKYIGMKNVSEYKEYYYKIPNKKSSIRPVVVGFGPSGMFSALCLARSGLKPVVIERGKSVEKRIADVKIFSQSGILDTSSNIQFGEGGAGTFSDGKLTTGINDERIRFILEEFVRFGADEDILCNAKPHIGTDKLVDIVRNMRNEIIRLGGEVLFEHRLTDIIWENGRVSGIRAENNSQSVDIQTDNVVLALGHSARDTFEMLERKNIAMTAKPFAVGVRIEHKQSMINNAMYGKFAQYLPPADYKLAVHLPSGRSVFTFCMCPGGVVVPAASEENRVVTNGMSNFMRDGENANSALLVGISPDDFGKNPLDGVKFQRELEERAFIAGGKNYNAPIQTVGDILADRKSTKTGSVSPTYRPNTTPSDMSTVFPEYMYSALKEAIVEMDKKIKGFADPDAVLTAVESRSSSPVRIKRDEVSLESDIKGLYPCGEGAGYAGGIVSAAVDGIKCAERIINKITG